MVLPAPFGPMIPRISPWRTARSTSFTARMPPKLTDRPRVSRAIGCSWPQELQVGERSPVDERRSAVVAAAGALEEHGAQDVGAVEQVGGGPVEADLALLHEHGPLGERDGDVDRLLDEHDRRAAWRGSPARSRAAARR